MRLMGSKLQASLAVEGKFTEEGLLAMTQGEDVTTALARALVNGLDGEGVEKMWSESGKPGPDALHPEALAEGLLLHVEPTAAITRGRRGARKSRRSTRAGTQLRLPGSL